MLQAGALRNVMHHETLRPPLLAQKSLVSVLEILHLVVMHICKPRYLPTSQRQCSWLASCNIFAT